MDDDKAFIIFALTLTAAVASIISASVMAGYAAMPSALSFVEHLSLSFGFRAAYKWIGGFDWADWSFGGAETPAVEEPATGFTAGATT